MTVLPERYRFTVDEYYRLAEAGILDEEDRVELLEGEIVMMSPIGGRHAACVTRLTHLLVRAAGEGAVVRVQSPVRLDDRSEPEPDLCLARSRSDFYAAGHPEPGDVLLIVEVADTSIGYDQQVKLPLYARAGIPELWIVDLGRDAVDVYRGPSRDGYVERRTFQAGEELQLPGLAAVLAVSEFLPGAV